MQTPLASLVFLSQSFQCFLNSAICFTSEQGCKLSLTPQMGAPRWEVQSPAQSQTACQYPAAGHTCWLWAEHLVTESITAEMVPPDTAS